MQRFDHHMAGTKASCQLEIIKLCVDAWGISHSRQLAKGGRRGGWGATVVKAAIPSFYRLLTEHLFDASMWWDEIHEEEGSSGAQL